MKAGEKLSKSEKNKSQIDSLSAELSGLVVNTNENVLAIAEIVSKMHEFGKRNFSQFRLMSSHFGVLKKIHKKTAIPDVITVFGSKPEAAMAIAL